MAQLDDLYTALKNADAAGDTAGAQKLAAYIQSMPKEAAPAPVAAPAPSRMDQFTDGLKNFTGKDTVLGAVRGAASIGATLQHALNPMEWGNKAADQERRQGIDAGLNSLGADPNSLQFKNAKMAAEIAGTSGVGGLIAKPVAAVVPALEAAVPAIAPYVGRVANALGSSGFTTGAPAATNALGKAGDMALRMAGGGATGAASTALVDPNASGTGAIVGAALPPALKLAGTVAAPVGRAVANALTGGAVAPEVQALAKRAEELGIQIPADRIANSKPLNAVAASLNYVPLSGRSAVESRMQDQLNQAVSKTFGQDSPNVTQALRKAQGDLGGKFEATLKGNTVKVDPQFMSDLADASNKASRELGSDGASIIAKQVDDIIAKAGTGEIDGQAAYNIKKTLDRIGGRNSPEAYYATDLKKALMGALDRSLGPEAATAFAKTRQQYGTMLDLQKLAQNGAEGDISIARLANMKNIGNPDLQELADISAQFLKAREGAHGAAQRVGAGALLGLGGHAVGGAVGGPVALAAGAGLGRATSMALDSNAARNMLLAPAGAPAAIDQINALAGPAIYRGAPRTVQNGTR